MKRFFGRKEQILGEAIGDVEYLDDQTLQDSVDWRAKGAVNPVQDQGQCGSCWAFSTTAAIEGAHKIKSGQLLKLAESQFVDCDKKDAGCNGGLETQAMTYAKSNAIELEKDYPYVAKTRKCSAKSGLGKVKVTAITRVPKKSVSQLKAAVQKQPTCIAVDAADRHFNSYKSGILDTTQCGTNLDHAITAVGYGSQNGKFYFIVRNSWGSSWGEKGYIRIAAPKDGAGVCGMLLDSARPTTD